MKIGLVLAKAPGYSETFLRSKIQGLQQSGHSVVLFSRFEADDFTDCPVILLPKQYRNIVKQMGMFLWACLGLVPHFKSVSSFVGLERQDGESWVRILKRLYSYAPILKTDVDWLHFGFGTLAIGAENLAAAQKAKMAVSFRGFDIGIYPIKHPNCYLRLWNKVTKIHVISDDVTKLVYAHGFKGQAPIVKITPAINTDFFSAAHPAEFTSPIKMLSVARLHWKKGLDYTLEALSQLKQEGLRFEYRIIGAGPEEEALKFASHQLGLQDQVLFMGQLDSGQVKRELENAHIYLQYSVQEGFCNAVLEAQAMGLLCLVSDAEGLAENVLNGQTGWVVARRQPELLALKIKQVMAMTKIDQQKIKDQAMLRVKRSFAIEKQQEAFVKFYQE